MKKNSPIVLKNKGDCAWLKGDNPEGFSKDLKKTSTSFVLTGRIAASGSVMSLIDGKGEAKVIPNDFCFARLFLHCAGLTQAPELPATTLSMGCYEGMFYECSSLKQAPQLPAPTLAVECDWGMFRECTGLVQFPMLPAVTLAMDCYKDMFEGCTGLNG